MRDPNLARICRVSLNRRDKTDFHELPVHDRGCRASISHSGAIVAGRSDLLIWPNGRGADAIGHNASDVLAHAPAANVRVRVEELSKGSVRHCGSVFVAFFVRVTQE